MLSASSEPLDAALCKLLGADNRQDALRALARVQEEVATQARLVQMREEADAQAAAEHERVKKQHALAREATDAAIKALAQYSPSTTLIIDHMGFFRQPAIGGQLGDAANNDKDAWDALLSLAALPSSSGPGANRAAAIAQSPPSPPCPPPFVSSPAATLDARCGM